MKKDKKFGDPAQIGRTVQSIGSLINKDKHCCLLFISFVSFFVFFLFMYFVLLFVALFISSFSLFIVI